MPNKTVEDLKKNVVQMIINTIQVQVELNSTNINEERIEEEIDSLIAEVRKEYEMSIQKTIDEFRDEPNGCIAIIESQINHEPKDQLI